MRNSITAYVTLLAIAAAGVSIGPAIALELITTQEAALPDAPGAALSIGLRGVTRGPAVVVVSPAPDAGQVRSPLDLMVKFEAHGGAAVDPRYVKVTYLKKPAINLTPRFGDAITAAGIDLRRAEMPPGTHYLKVEIKDTAGRTGSAAFAVAVEN